MYIGDYMKNKRSNIKTKVQDIIDYWIKYEDECGLNFDWAEASTVCWRCGCERKLQRCHIIPDSLGGTDEPSNFVLLCSECHQEAPNIESKEFMWNWIKSYYCPFYNTFWQNRAMDEYERIYKKSFPSELKERNIITNHAASKFWNLKTGKTSYHFGHPYGNVATIAGNYKLHLDAFDKKYNGKYLSDEEIKNELNFESLTHSICSLAEKYSFSVWEGGTKNPYSLCIFTCFPLVNNNFGVSIRMNKKGIYKMCFTNECNPNNILIKDYNIPLPNNNNDIVFKVQAELKNLISLHGMPKNDKPSFLVVDPYWKRKNSNY